MEIFPLNNFVGPLFKSGTELEGKAGFKNQALSRLYLTGAALLFPPATIIDGIVAGAFSLFAEACESLKNRPDLTSLSEKHAFTIECFEYAGLSLSFLSIVGILGFMGSAKSTKGSDAWCGLDGSGIISHHVRNVIFEKAEEIGCKNGLANRIVAKLIYANAIPLCLITRIIDLALGVLVTGAALVCRGKNVSLNNCAYRGLMVDDFIQDVFFATIKLINLKSLVKLNKDSGELEVKY